jgi:hypothetical protein
VVGAEIDEAGGGVREEVPDDDQDGTGHRDEGFLFADAAHQAPVALAEEGVGLRGGGCDLAEDAFQVGVALAGAARAGAGPGLDGARRQAGPRHQVCGGGELGHVQADLGDDDLGGEQTDTGDLVEAVQDRQATRVVGGVGVAGARRRGRRGAGQFGDQQLGAGGELVDLGGEGVDLVEQHPGQEGVVVVETTIERLNQRGTFGSHLAQRELGED